MEEIGTEMNVIYVLYSIDTRKPEYVKAIGVVDELGPVISNYATEYTKVLVNATYRKELEKQYGSYLFTMYENQLKTFNEKVLNREYAPFVHRGILNHAAGGDRERAGGVHRGGICGGTGI